MFDKLRHTLETWQPLSETDWVSLQSCLQKRQYKRGEALLNAGQVCQGIAFVNQGAFRTYTLKDGREVHTQFSFETDFVTDYESLTMGQPSTVSLVAVEPAEVIYFSRNGLIDLYQQAPNLMQVGQRILENVVVGQSRYASLFTLYSPAERYQQLVQQHPQVVQRVPLQYIASYLGMARETLSRIRAQK